MDKDFLNDKLIIVTNTYNLGEFKVLCKKIMELSFENNLQKGVKIRDMLRELKVNL